MRLHPDSYRQSAVELASGLIGKLLCRALGDKIIRLRIIETEAYCGESDTACHARKGRTKRTQTMYEQGGVAYIYLCYGIHSLLNIVAGEKDIPEAVLIRGVVGYEGPGRLTKALHIGTDLNGEDLNKSQNLWLEDDGFICDYNVSKRIGIDYATTEYKEKLWRFSMRKN